VTFDPWEGNYKPLSVAGAFWLAKGADSVGEVPRRRLGYTGKVVSVALLRPERPASVAESTLGVTGGTPCVVAHFPMYTFDSLCAYGRFRARAYA
jgi:hypothetical protein